MYMVKKIHATLDRPMFVAQPDRTSKMTSSRLKLNSIVLICLYTHMFNVHDIIYIYIACIYLKGRIKPVKNHLRKILRDQIAKVNHETPGLQIKCFEIWADDALLIGWNCSWTHLSDSASIIDYVECLGVWAYFTQQPLGRSPAY